MIGMNDLDRFAENLATEILDSRLHCENAAEAVGIGEGAVLVTEGTYLDDIIGHLI